MFQSVRLFRQFQPLDTYLIETLLDFLELLGPSGTLSHFVILDIWQQHQ